LKTNKHHFLHEYDDNNKSWSEKEKLKNATIHSGSGGNHGNSKMVRQRQGMARHWQGIGKATARQRQGNSKATARQQQGKATASQHGAMAMAAAAIGSSTSRPINKHSNTVAFTTAVATLQFLNL